MAEITEGLRYNRKNPRPSTSMHHPDGGSYRCRWIEDSITIHSDGNVSCGLDDPHGQRSYGNIYTQSVAEIFANPEYGALQHQLAKGWRCLECGHYRPRKNNNGPPARPIVPTRLVVETTVTCNIRCVNVPCFANNDANETTRNSKMLDLEKFKAAIDQVAPGLKTVNFYNYGEPFMHRQAEDMLLYMREKAPDAFIVTSTNGIPLFNKSRAERVVAARPDRITFTIGGITQESYGRYHVRGRVDQALGGLKNVCDAKRAQQNKQTQIVWRYLAFHWNDSDREIDSAIAMAKEWGVDCFSLYLTNTPPEGRSIRLSPGSPGYWKYRGFVHVNDEGELNHIYRSELPDSDGLYRVVENHALGRIRWTSSRARLRIRREGDMLNVSVTTNRQKCRDRNDSCTLHTAWGRFDLPVQFKRWHHASIPVPRRFKAHDEFEVELVANDPWYPAEEAGAANDMRCLGVILEVGEKPAEAALSYLALPVGLDPMRWGEAAPLPGGVTIYDKGSMRRSPDSETASPA